RAGLGALHCGLGHTHTSGFLTTLGVPSISSSNFKKRERESGKAVEEVAKDSCNQFNEEEKRLSTTGNEEVVKLGVSLPGGKDLTGEDLRATLEEAIRPFLSHDSVKKLAPAGSSQRNESVNSSIGSKAPKIRHYGGSQSSDFRTAAGIAQFNKGNRYLTLATEKMGLAQTHITEQNTDKIDKKRKRDGERKSTKEFKKARRNSRKKKNQKTNSAEKREEQPGTTQVHGISVEFCKGRKTLLRRGKELEAVSQTQGLSDFCSFLKQQSRSFQVVLIAHNGEKFDFPVLINALRRNNLLELFLATGVVLVDSLKIVSTEMKQKGSPLYSCKSKSLSDVYEVLLKEKFDAHDAQEDATALSRILFQSPLQ
ncbi:unnamed protein product, partial [Pocillopora meandrina]